MRHNHLTRMLITSSLAFWPAMTFASDYLTDARALMGKGDLKAAQIQLRNAVRSDPNDAEARFRLGQVDLTLGDVVAADKDLRAAREANPNSPEIIRTLAEAYIVQGHFDETLKDFNVTNKDPATDSEILVARARAQIYLHQLDQAQTSLTEAERLAPGRASPLLAEAQLALSRGDKKAASEKTDRALALEPNFGDALLLKAQLLWLAKDSAGALAALDKVIANNPGAVGARLERATVLLGINENEKAGHDVDWVLSNVPRNVTGLYLRANLQARANNWAGADATLSGIAPALPNLQRGLYLQALVKQNLKQSAQAEDAARRYIERVPADPEGLKLFAAMLLAKGQPGQAIDLLKKPAENGNADPGILYLLARAYTQTGHPAEAISYLAKLAEKAPQNPALRVELANLRLASGDADGAARELESALEAAPSQTGIAELLVLTNLSSSNPDNAEPVIEKLRKAQGDTPVVGNLEGLLKLTKLDINGARAEFTRVMQAHPEFIPAQLNLARVDRMQGNGEEADQLLRNILARQPAHAQALAMYTGAMIKAGRIEEAKAALERAHDAAPSSPGITANLADLYTQTGNASKALDLLTAEAGKQTPNPSLLAAYARAQVAAGKTADAIESYTRLVQAQPDDVGARQRLASLLLASNEPEHARSVIQEGLSRTPRNYQLMQDYVAIDLKAKGLDAALTTAERLADQAQDFPAARALRGDTFMLAQKYDQAAQAYAAAMEAAPSSLIASRQAAALAQSGHPDQASQVLSNWLRQNPNDTSIIELLASYDIAAHRLNDAKTHLEAVLEAKPRDAIAMNNLAWVYQQLKDPRARSLAQRAYVLMPGGQTADTLGWILTSEGDASTGLQLLRQAHADAANDPRIKYHLAVALKDVGQRDEAIKLLAPVVSSDVKFDEKPQAEQLMAQLSQKS